MAKITIKSPKRDNILPYVEIAMLHKEAEKGGNESENENKQYQNGDDAGSTETPTASS